MTALHPAVAGPRDDANETSLVFRLEHRHCSFLLPADIGAATEEGLVLSGVRLRSDVLELSHHGTMGDHAALVQVHVLDRVLDRRRCGRGSSRCGSRASRRATSTCRSRWRRRRSQRPRFVSATSLEDLRELEFLDRRDLGVDRCGHTAGVALLDEGATRNRPIPGGAMANSYSLVESNSWSACLMMARIRLALCSPLNTLSVCGRIAVDLDGGREARRDEQVHPFARPSGGTGPASARSACSRFILLSVGCVRQGARRSVLVLRLVPRLFPADDASGHHFREALVEGLHALRWPVGSSSTSARSCPRGSGCGWPACRS